MHDWLLGLTRPEDHLAWAWVAIAAGHAVVGLLLSLMPNPMPNLMPGRSRLPPSPLDQP